jgi:hypothetical protein
MYCFKKLLPTRARDHSDTPNACADWMCTHRRAVPRIQSASYLFPLASVSEGILVCVIEVFPSAGDAESRRCDADSNIIFGDPEPPHFDGISCLVITAR